MTGPGPVPRPVSLAALLLLLLLLLVAATAEAESPYLVRDLRPGGSEGAGVAPTWRSSAR